MVLDERPTDRINDSNGAARKNFEANTTFCISFHYNGDESYLYVTKTEVFKFKADNNISWYNFCLRKESKEFSNDKQSEISLNVSLYDFSVDHSSI